MCAIIRAMENNIHGHKTILKKQKSLPLGTTGRKNVHFADGCGLSLVSVHKISMDDLTIPTNTNKDVIQPPTLELNLTFPQPISLDNFAERLSSCCVSLENVLVSNCTIMGTVKVRNIAYHKVVLVRHTFDAWKTCQEATGSYVPLSCDGNHDRFSFAISVPSTMKDGDRIEFAICYRTVSPDNEFWDNNGAKNYVIECKEKVMPRNASYGLLWSQVIPNFKR